MPPLGTVFVAWSPAPQSSTPGCNASERARRSPSSPATDKRSQQSGSRGFSIGLEADARRRLGRAVAERDPDVERIVEELGHEEYILLELERSVSYQLSLVAAPVFGPDGGVVMAIAMFGFRSPLDAVELTRAGIASSPPPVRSPTRSTATSLTWPDPDVRVE